MLPFDFIYLNKIVHVLRDEHNEISPNTVKTNNKCVVVCGYRRRQSSAKNFFFLSPSMVKKVKYAHAHAYRRPFYLSLLISDSNYVCISQ